MHRDHRVDVSAFGSPVQASPASGRERIIFAAGPSGSDDMAADDPPRSRAGPSARRAFEESRNVAGGPSVIFSRAGTSSCTTSPTFSPARWQAVLGHAESVPHLRLGEPGVGHVPVMGPPRSAYTAETGVGGKAGGPSADCPTRPWEVLTRLW